MLPGCKQPFLVEFERPNGQVLVAELIGIFRGGKVGDFRFQDFPSSGAYAIHLTGKNAGQPTLKTYRGKFAISKAGMADLQVRLRAVTDKVLRCAFCGGDVHYREPGQPPPLTVRKDGKDVWCCSGCRQPELIR